MKKIGILTGLAFALLLFSCSSSKKAHSPAKTIDGHWQLQTIVAEGVPDKIKAKFFNEAEFNCFVGSSWSFNSSKSLGSYSISKNANECAALKRNISWSVTEPEGQPKQFQFKRLDNAYKEIGQGTEEFRFTILQLYKNLMQLKSESTFDGQQASFTYNFIRL